MMTKQRKEIVHKEYRQKARWFDDETIEKKIKQLQEEMEKDFLSDSDPDEYEKKIIFYEELEYEKEERKQRKSKLKTNRNEPKP